MDNTKLWEDGIACFGLPPKKTCPGSTKECRSYCYCNFHNYCYPNVKKARSRNHQAAKDENTFIEKVLGAIEYLPRFFRYLRIHDSGDFFSQSYLNMWKKIARKTPDIQFYTYTKSLHLDWRRLPKNFTYIQSLGGKYDSYVTKKKPIAKIFNSAEEIEASGYVNGSHSDLVAAQGTMRIGLIARGTGRHIWRKFNERNCNGYQEERKHQVTAKANRGKKAKGN